MEPPIGLAQHWRVVPWWRICWFTTLFVLIRLCLNLPRKCPTFAQNNIHGTTAKQPLARTHFANDRRAVVGALRMGSPRSACQHPVLSGQSQCQVQPDFFAQNTLGKKRSGGFVFAHIRVVQVATCRARSPLKGGFADSRHSLSITHFQIFPCQNTSISSPVRRSTCP